MGLLEIIYDHSPILFQNIMCSVSGKIKYNNRYKGEYLEMRKFCKEYDSWDIENQLQYQNKQLKDFILFAFNNSEFYHELYKDADLSKINSVEDLHFLPIVDKEMLRSNIDNVYTIKKKDAIIGNTGGTTGKSLTVRFTREDSNIRMAVLDHFKSRMGFENLKMKRATFNGKHIIPPNQKKHIYWRYNAACKQMIYSSFHLTEENLGYYVQSLNNFKPKAIDGFFTSICDVASFIERNNIRLSFTPLAIFPTSETLTVEGRNLLERVFKCKVYDQYASSEGAPFITECPNQVLHVESNTGVFEVMPDGKVLVTSFTTHGTPLIRYAIGDWMELADPDFVCNCGLHGQIIKKINGRSLDYLYKDDGAKINAGNVSNLLKYLPNSVIRSQFIQTKYNEIKILIEIDKKRYDEKAKKDILKECQHTFGNNMNITIEVVDNIPRTDGGKFRMIINNVDKDK